MYKINSIIRNSIRFYSSSNGNFNLKQTFLTDKYTNHTYGQILSISKQLSKDLLSSLNKSNLNGDKVGVLCSNNYTYLCSILAIWMSNGVPFCLSKLYPNNLIDYFVNDSKCKLIINGTDHSTSSCINFNINESEYFKSTHNLFKQQETIDDVKDLIFEDKNNKQKPILLLYTSGTSGNKPKGCVITYENLFSSIEMMIQTYEWSKNDKMLSTLPLNHYSGLVYTLLTPFFIGARVNLLPKFDAKKVWSIILNSDDVNMFIGVPTIYTQLCDYYYKNKQEFPNNIEKLLKQKMRLIASGSAPLNLKTFNDWFELTKYNIIERYGMTEIGMALSNSLDENKQIGGTVGRPIGQVKVRIVDLENDEKVLIESCKNNDIYENSNHLFGELQIKGTNVFKEYLNKPDQTEISFTKDGWFRTGDTAQFLTDKKVYKIIGRTSVDVIKSGGYKISALDIEKELLAHPLIEDVAVMGLSDPTWGQRVFALLVLKPNNEKLDLVEFKKWCKTRLPKYSVPTLVKIIDKMPRNQLGKVIKKELIKIYEQDKFISKI